MLRDRCRTTERESNFAEIYPSTDLSMAKVGEEKKEGKATYNKVETREMPYRARTGRDISRAF